MYKVIKTIVYQIIHMKMRWNKYYIMNLEKYNHGLQILIYIQFLVIFLLLYLE